MATETATDDPRRSEGQPVGDERQGKGQRLKSGHFARRIGRLGKPVRYGKLVLKRSKGQWVVARILKGSRHYQVDLSSLDLLYAAESVSEPYRFSHESRDETPPPAVYERAFSNECYIGVSIDPMSRVARTIEIFKGVPSSRDPYFRASHIKSSYVAHGSYVRETELTQLRGTPIATPGGVPTAARIDIDAGARDTTNESAALQIAVDLLERAEFAAIELNASLARTISDLGNLNTAIDAACAATSIEQTADTVRELGEHAGRLTERIAKLRARVEEDLLRDGDG